LIKQHQWLTGHAAAARGSAAGGTDFSVAEFQWPAAAPEYVPPSRGDSEGYRNMEAGSMEDDDMIGVKDEDGMAGLADGLEDFG
jgi:hypothetical protein